MKIVIPGGSGQVGTLLARAFHGQENEVVVLSRNPPAVPWRRAEWDGETVGPWAAELDGADVVINLAGFTVNCRYNERNKARILRTRVASTRAVADAIAQANRPPSVWLQASTATIYAHTFGPAHDELHGTLGGSEPGAPEKWNFSIEVATAWEREFDAASAPKTRKVKMRSALIMSPDQGGIFDTILGLVRLGLGGRQGNGRQYVSWVHYEDFIAAVRWLIERSEFEGPVNIASPNPVPNDQFMRELRQAWGMPLGLPAMAWMLEIGAIVLWTETELILKSRRVVPGKLAGSGFDFRFPIWKAAAQDLCAQWRERRAPGRSAA